MATSAAGNSAPPRPGPRASLGFTLLELLVVMAVIGLAMATVTVALRDSAQTQIEREAERLAALLESARARSRAQGAPVTWRQVRGGFTFDGLPERVLPREWLDPATTVRGNPVLVLGPEPVIEAQAVTLEADGRSVQITTDGVRPFTAGALANP